MSIKLDYSELLLNIQRDYRQCHEALLTREYEKAARLADAIQLQAAELKAFCKDECRATQLQQLITQVYFYCNNNDPQGIYPTETIDLLEFTQKLLAVLKAQKDI